MKDFELFFPLLCYKPEGNTMTIQVGPAPRGVDVSMNVLGSVQPSNAHPSLIPSVCTLVSILYTVLRRYHRTVSQM